MTSVLMSMLTPNVSLAKVVVRALQQCFTQHLIALNMADQPSDSLLGNTQQQDSDPWLLQWQHWCMLSTQRPSTKTSTYSQTPRPLCFVLQFQLITEALIVYPTSCIVGVYNLFIWLFLSILNQQNEPANRELNLCLVVRPICTNAICTQILQTPFLINIMIYVECIYRADTSGSCVIFCYIVQPNSFIHRPSEEHAYIQSITRKNYLKVGLLCFCIKICM